MTEDSAILPTLSLAYAPDFSIYHEQTAESYNAHRFIMGLTAKAGAWSCGVENTFSFIQGSDVAPFYPGALQSAYGTGAPRERREQMQDRSAIAFRYDQENWFIRPVASLLYYDLHTELMNVLGYQNYPDRYDANGGLDFGYKLRESLALTLGYRYGHQYQEQMTFSPYSASSDYQRVLAGVEGKPWEWLDVKLQAGPDFREDQENSAEHITPVNDLHPIHYYGEATAAATLSARDKITLRYKQWQWVSSTGKIPYFDSCYELGYRRKLTSRLTAELGSKVGSADYESGNLPICHRYDWLFSGSASLAYAANAHLTFIASYTADFGRNGEEEVLHPETREFNRNLFSLGCTLAW